MQISRNVRYTNHVTGYHYCDHVTDTLFWKGEGGNILTFFTSRNFQFPTAPSYHISHHIISYHITGTNLLCRFLRFAGI